MITRISAAALALGFLLPLASLSAQRPATIGPQVRHFVAVDGSVAFTNIRVIDGMGTAAVEGQTVVVAGGKIAAMGRTGSVTVPAGARTIDGTGKTLMPGMVGLHDHSYYTTAGRPPRR